MEIYIKRLYDLRIDNDLNQEDISKILDTTKQNYGLYENGKRNMKICDYITLAKFYKVSLDYLVGLSDNPKKSWLEK